ncbi:MAG: tetratricopeptide repeat protein [Magnetococcales bacterium]|nr:tetratricopeptide repeat protein [Magnetococcales bacterium]
MGQSQRQRSARTTQKSRQTPENWLADQFALGVSHYQSGQLSQAALHFQNVLTRRPECVECANNLGIILRELGQIDQAIAVLQQAIHHATASRTTAAGALAQRFISPLYNNLGIALRHKGQLTEAIASYQAALAIRADDAEVLHNMAIALQELGQLEQAESSFRLALHHRPYAVGSLSSLGVLLKEQGRLDEAEQPLRQALQLRPDHAEAGNNLASLFLHQGRIAEAIEQYQQTVAAHLADAAIHSNLIMAQHYSADWSAAELFAETRRWQTRHALPLVAEIIPHKNSPDPGRRLRIGYVSPDLRQHPVGFFMAPVFRGHDRDQFELFCYASVTRPDAMTAQIEAACDHWRDVRGVNNAALAQQVRHDGIDILVDLSGHTRAHRLQLFARKPAPVQITAGGHFSTTGLDSMDGLIADRFHVPEEMEQAFSETVIRLPGGYVCYDPPAYAPAVVDPPHRSRGYVTFGCYNSLAKLTPQLLEIWCQLLLAVSTARLLLRTPALADAMVRQRLYQWFNARGIAGERIELAGGCSHAQFLAGYGEIDIALDPFPYSGGLTTCEALWMGVPVVTLTGDRFCGRHSTSHLAQLGLYELITDSPQAYLDCAIALAQQESLLLEYRRTLRDRMRASSLGDHTRYVASLEAVLRQMWSVWCHNGTGRVI